MELQHCFGYWDNRAEKRVVKFYSKCRKWVKVEQKPLIGISWWMQWKENDQKQGQNLK